MNKLLMSTGILISLITSGWSANSLVNGGFESPVIGETPPDPVKSWVGGKVVTYYDTDVSGWETTATDHEIEFWSDGAGTPFEGKQFIELNANEVAAVYQDVPTIPGKKFNWFVAHRGRNGVDIARVLIGPASGNLSEVRQMEDDKDVWGTYLGSYEVPAGQTITRLQFEAVSTASGNDTIGNFLDGFKVGPVAQYKMDECYWLGTPATDVFDSSLNGTDGEAMNGAHIVTDDAVINHAGSFDGSDDFIDVEDKGLEFNETFTLTMWVKPASVRTDAIIEKFTDAFRLSDKKGWILSYDRDFGKDDLIFSMKIGGDVVDVKLTDLTSQRDWTGDWHFIAVRYDGESLMLRFDDLNKTVDASGEIEDSSNHLAIGAHVDGSQAYEGLIDEVKIFAVALGDDEIDTLKTNDMAGNNYTGIVRESVTCSATIRGGSWELIGIPVDFRNAENNKTTVADIFADDMNGDFNGTDNDDWRLYRREYNITNNSSSYILMTLSDPLEFGVGYWLGSRLDSNWSENGALQIDYNSTTNGTDECVAERCVELPVTPVSLNFESPDNDINDGSGPYRYYMTGFVGKAPIDWADCRLIVSDADGSNREVLSPSEAETAGYMNKEVWQYSPSSGNDYSTCDDTTPGSCMLYPYKGFWIELHGPTKNKTVKLLIPKE